MRIEDELDYLFTKNEKPSIGVLFTILAKIAKENKVRITFTQTPNSTEHSIEPWESYQPACPYSRGGEDK